MTFATAYLIEVAKIILFYELSKRTLLWLITYTKNEFDMDNLKQSAKIRRAVENMGYQLLEDAPPPEVKYDGETYYTVEHWEIDLWELQEKTAHHLIDKDWEFEAGSLIDQQIKFHCKQFLASEAYEDMIEQQRQALIEEREEEKYQAAHMPTSLG